VVFEKLAGMTSSATWSELKQIIVFNTNKPKHNLIAPNQVKTNSP